MQGMEAEDRRAAYAADVTYVTNSELGFDYLRDNLAQEGSDLVLQRAFNFCIIDEVRSRSPRLPFLREIRSGALVWSMHACMHPYGGRRSTQPRGRAPGALAEHGDLHPRDAASC